MVMYTERDKQCFAQGVLHCHVQKDVQKAGFTSRRKHVFAFTLGGWWLKATLRVNNEVIYLLYAVIYDLTVAAVALSL